MKTARVDYWLAFNVAWKIASIPRLIGKTLGDDDK